MPMATSEPIISITDLIKSFNKSDTLCESKSMKDDIDNIALRKTRLNIKERQLKNKYWSIVKNHISLAFFFSNQNKINEIKKNIENAPKEKKKDKSHLQKKQKVYLGEREWFIKKFEREVGGPNVEMVPFETLKQDILYRKQLKREKHLYKQYKEPPPRDNLPAIVWEGPPLKNCFCISPMDNCDCKGDMVLPFRVIPSSRFNKAIHWLSRLNRIHNFKKLKLPTPTPPDKPFAERLQEHLEAETVVQNQLMEMDVKRGPEFCVFRCYHYYVPKGNENNRYFQLKRELHEAYKNRKKVEPVKVVMVQKPAWSISDEIIDGLYRSVSTQATTDENGEFIMGEVSHILFGRGDASVLQDIEGTPYAVCSYHDVIKKKSQPSCKEIERILSLKRIKNRFSKLTSSFMTSIVEIQDPGIPSNTRATQDPSLDNYIESIKVPSKYKFVKDSQEEVCPCCKKYKELQTVETDRIESNVVDNYDDFLSEGVDSLLTIPFTSEMKRLKKSNLNKLSINKENLVVDKLQKQRRNLGFSDDENQNIIKKQKFHKHNNQNDNIELLKKNLITNKLDKKQKSFEKNKGLFAIRSESMINVEDNKTIKKNKQMNSLEFLESIKPCCIDNIYNQLEKKLSNEKYITKLLEDIFKEADRLIYSKEKKAQETENKELQEIENVEVQETENVEVQEIENVEVQETENVEVQEIENVEVQETENVEVKEIENIDVQEIGNIKTSNKTSDLDVDIATEDVEISKKQIDSAGANMKINNSSKFSININKFSDFIKKQKSSIKKFISKKIKDARSKNRKSLSLVNFKLKMNKSCKKLNNAVSSFCKKSSNDTKQFIAIKKDVDKLNSSNDSKISALASAATTSQNITNTQDSKISEKEVFSVQYNSTYEFHSKNNKQ